VELLAQNPWAFGWDAFVAIGTLALAVVTFVLVLLTRKLAKASAAELRAQWRPVILPASDPPSARAIATTQSRVGCVCGCRTRDKALRFTYARILNPAASVPITGRLARWRQETNAS